MVVQLVCLGKRHLSVTNVVVTEDGEDVEPSGGSAADQDPESDRRRRFERGKDLPHVQILREEVLERHRCHHRS